MTSSSPDDPLAHDLDAFLDAAQYARGLAPATRAAYANALRPLLRDLRRQGLADWARVDAPTLARHLRALRDARGYAPATLAQHAAAIRALFGWLLDQGRIQTSPLDALPPAKRPKRLPKTLPEGALNALIEAVEGDDLPTLRDRAVLELLYGCGLRCAELCGLNLHDADLTAHTLRVRGKGAKERVVPYGPPAHAALLRWLDARRRFALAHKKGARAADLLAPGAPLLLSPTGRRLGRHTLAAIVHRRIHAFLPEGTQATPHTLRHAYATHLLEHGAPLMDIRQLLGHASVSTTQLYTHVAPGRLRAAFDAAFPRS